MNDKKYVYLLRMLNESFLLGAYSTYVKALEGQAAEICHQLGIDASLLYTNGFKVNLALWDELADEIFIETVEVK